MGSFDELHGVRHGVAKLEAELEELRRTLRITEAASPGSHATFKIIAEIQHYETIRERMLRELNFQEADSWRSFGERFMDLAREEQGRTDAITSGKALRSIDQVLRASCHYEERPAVWERNKPEQGFICLLKTPPHGVWNYDSDGLSENWYERARLCVAEAGRALPDYQKGADPEDFWLHRAYFDLLKNNSDLLFAASNEGGIILSVCVASATFSTRLQRKALEQAEFSPVLDSDKTTQTVKSKPTNGPAAVFTHSADFRSVTLRGETYTLTAQQAQMIKILREAHSSGNPDVSIDYIMAQVDADFSRWQDTWRSKPDARRALVRGGGSKGTLRLNL